MQLKKVGTCDSRDYDAINALAYLPVSDNRLKEIQEATEQDPTLHSLRLIIQRGWPNTKAELSEELKPYFDIRDTLQVEDGIILKGERLLIPTSMRKEIKARLHTAHLGKDSMLRRARELIYWPGLTDEITQIAESCEVCMMTSRRQQKEPMIPHVRGNAAWQKVGTDIFTINNRNYLITVDYFGGFWEVDFLTSTYSSTIILKLKAHFSRYGIPQELMSDNAQFESRECTQFYSEWGINKTSSSPGYPQSNGKVESAVKAAKTMISKCMKTGEDQYLALLELRNTPVQGINVSPAQLLFQKRTRSILLQRPATLKPNQTAPIERMEKRVRQQKEHYDKSAHRPYEDLVSGQKVVYDHFSSTRKRPYWRKGTIDKKVVTPRSFYIDTRNRKIRRNRKHIKAEKGDGVDLDLLPQSTSHGEDCPPTSFSENDDEETTGQFDTIPD